VDKYLELLLVNLGLPGALIAVIIYVIKSQSKTREKELETSSKNNDKLVESIKSMAYEFSKSNQINVELSTKSDIHSKNHIESIERIEAQIIGIHERANNIAVKETEIYIIVKEMSNKMDKCHK